MIIYNIIVDSQGVCNILPAAPVCWFFTNILGKMSRVPAGLISKTERSFPEMTAERSILAMTAERSIQEETRWGDFLEVGISWERVFLFCGRTSS
jgi:hypothetical protein